MSLALITPSLIGAVLSSGDPFLYISLLVMAGIAWIAKNVYKDMQKDKEKAESTSSDREQRLLDREEHQRNESRIREEKLQEQINKTNESHREITLMMNSSFESLGSVVSKISESQEKIIETQKETYEAVQNLNQTVQILNYDMRNVKDRLENVERNLKDDGKEGK